MLQGSSLPYHAIISLGTLRRLPPVDEYVRWWPICAPLLEEVWNNRRWGPPVSESASGATDDLLDAGRRLGHFLERVRPPSAPRMPYGDVPTRVARGVISSAVRAGAVSCEQSVSAALSYLQADEGAGLSRCVIAASDGCGSEGHVPATVELSYLREGHTSSVFRVEAWFRDALIPSVAFVLNVSRDTTDARDDLTATAHNLATWSARSPSLAVAVYDSGLGSFAWFGETRSVAVVAVQLLEPAYELHALRDPADPDHGLLVQVDYFQHQPNRLPDIAARQADTATSDQLWMQVIAARTELSDINWQERLIVAPEIELNDGDAVSLGGDGGVAFVGSSPSPWQGPPGAWPYIVSLSSARDESSRDGARIFWGKPDCALKAMHNGLRCAHGTKLGDEHTRKQLEAALEFNSGTLASVAPYTVSGSGAALVETAQAAMATLLDELQELT